MGGANAAATEKTDKAESNLLGKVSVVVDCAGVEKTDKAESKCSGPGEPQRVPSYSAADSV